MGTLGLILAGGKSRRMGAEKAFLTLSGESLIARTVERARPQVRELLINANGDSTRFAPFGYPVIEDRVAGFLGPLAGIFAGLDWLRANRPDAGWLATFACDCPFFPADLVERLRQVANAERVPLTVAASGGRRHPVFGLWSTAIAETSQTVLVEKGLRKMDDLVARIPHGTADFAADPVDPFFNINTPEDLAEAERLIAQAAR
jgi:molybdopterin-guanine dinucleotide biosynthesis protein A